MLYRANIYRLCIYLINELLTQWIPLKKTHYDSFRIHKLHHLKLLYIHQLLVHLRQFFETFLIKPDFL